MRILVKLTLLVVFFSTPCFSQEETDSFLGEDNSISTPEEGSLQSEIPPSNNFDFSELENPELQELNPVDEPLWNDKYQNFEFDEIPSED
jgi:hypothetical protein